MIPVWFHDLSIAVLALGLACFLLVAVDVARHRQGMGIMNIVWPTVALFGSVFVVFGYFRYGRASAREAMDRAKAAGGEPPARGQPFAAVVGKGTLHCGAGCMLGDLVAEWLAFAVPTVAVCCGWHSLFDDRMYAVWVLDFVFAFALGIVFQYFAIAPMRGLGLGPGLGAALKADALSLTAWQVGMYGFMALAQLVWYPHAFGLRAQVDTPEFWFAMTLAMIAGFATAYPVNWWLIRSGVKESM